MYTEKHPYLCTLNSVVRAKLHTNWNAFMIALVGNLFVVVVLSANIAAGECFFHVALINAVNNARGILLGQTKHCILLQAGKKYKRSVAYIQKYLYGDLYCAFSNQFELKCSVVCFCLDVDSLKQCTVTQEKDYQFYYCEDGSLYPHPPHKAQCWLSIATTSLRTNTHFCQYNQSYLSSLWEQT